MVTFTPLEELVGDYLSQVSLDEQGRIPLFHTNMDRAKAAFWVLYKRVTAAYGIQQPPDYMLHPQLHAHITKETERLAQLGAIAAQQRLSGGKTYDVACGIPIPGFSYALLTGNPPICIENNSETVGEAKALADLLHVQSEVVQGDALSFFKKRMIRQNDFLILSNLPRSLYEPFFFILRNFKPNFLIHDNPSEILKHAVLDDTFEHSLYDRIGKETYNLHFIEPNTPYAGHIILGTKK